MTQEEWNARYNQQDTPWDLGGPTPELERLLEECRFSNKTHPRVLIPGAGSGYDALLLARDGFDVTALDFASKPIAALSAKASALKLKLECLKTDFFDFANHPSEHGLYDLIWEYTFFCAIPPEQRSAYTKAISLLLRPGGLFLALFFPLRPTSKLGPPYLVSKEEIQTLFSKDFIIHFEKPLASIELRRGAELLGVFKKL